MNSGLGVRLRLFIGLAFRSASVWFPLIGTKLDVKEKLYCIICCISKATVQAAIAGVPLALGLPCGNMVLSVAVVSIIITAPLGAIAMDLSYKKLLTEDK